jgi:hypothetical protein
MVGTATAADILDAGALDRYLLSRHADAVDRARDLRGIPADRPLRRD